MKYCANRNAKDVTGKCFWKNKPCFSDKLKSYEKIILIENDKIINDKKVASTLNHCFSNIVPSLEIPWLTMWPVQL